MAEPGHASADAARAGRVRVQPSDSDHFDWPGAASKQLASDEHLTGSHISARLAASHAALLVDPRLRSPASGTQRERLLQGLQHSYGNSYVARLIARTQAAVPSDSSGPMPAGKKPPSRAKRGATGSSRGVSSKPAAPRAPETPDPDITDSLEEAPSPQLETARPPAEPSILDSLPNTFHSPGIASAVQQIIQATKANQAGVSQDARELRGAIEKQSASRAEEMLDEARNSMAALVSLVDDRQAESDATFGAGRALIQAESERQTDTAILDSDLALASLDEGIAAQHEDTSQVVKSAGEGVEETASSEAVRATTSAEDTSQEISSGARDKRGQAPGDADVQAAVGDTIGQLASDAVGQVQANGTEFAEQSHEAAQQTVGQLHEGEGLLRDAIDAGSSQLENALGTCITATLSTLGQMLSRHLQLLESQRAEMFDALGKGKVAAVAMLRRAGRKASDRAREAGRVAVARSQQGEADARVALEQGAAGVIEQLSELDTQYDLDDAGVPEVVEPVSQALSDGRTGLSQAQEQPAAGLVTSLDQGKSLFKGRLQDAELGSRASLDRLGEAGAAGTSGAAAAISARSDAIVGESRATQQEAVAGFMGKVKQGSSEAEQAWVDDESQVEAGIREQVDSGVAGHADAQSQAAGHFDRAVDGAAEEAESSILEAIWAAVTDFLSGLLETAVITTVAFAAGATIGFLAGGPFLAVALGLGAAITTGATILTAAGIESFNTRAEEMGRELPDDAPWYVVAAAALSVAALVPLDALRITSIIDAVRGEPLIRGPELTPAQRAYKATEGVLSLGTFLLLMRVFGRAGGPGGAVRPKSGWGGLLARVRDFFRPRPASGEAPPPGGEVPAPGSEVPPAEPAAGTILGGPGPDVVTLHRYANASGEVRPGSYWTEWETLSPESASRMTGVPQELIGQRLTVRVRRGAIDAFFRDAGSKQIPGEGAALEYQNRVAISPDAIEVTPMRPARGPGPG